MGRRRADTAALPAGGPDPQDPAIRRRAAQRTILEHIAPGSPEWEAHEERLERAGDDPEARAKAYERTVIANGLKPVYTEQISWAVELRRATLAVPSAS